MIGRRARRGLVAWPGFELVRPDRGTFALIRSDCARLPLQALLLDPERYLGGCGSPAGGRGHLARVCADPSRTLILKKYRRGGALANTLPDLFLGWGRMLADLEASERARSRSVPCARVVGLILKKRAGFARSAYLLSEEIPDATTLAEALAAAPPGVAAIELARRALLTVKRLHGAGIIHRDLNLRNLLVGRSEVFVIDLDGAAILPAPTVAARFSNLSRLDRSYIKTFGGIGPLSHADRLHLLSTYCGDDAKLLRDIESRLGAHKRSLRLHGLFWRRPS